MNEIRKIVIVDDLQENRQVIAKILNVNLKKIELYLISNGKDLVEMLKKEEILPDLILLDIMMPELSGIEVAKIIKKNKEWENLPIIFLTAKTDVESKVEAFEVGGVDYITKPFNQFELISRVKTHLKLKKMTDNLNELVNEKTLSLILALEKANVYNDTDTGNHIKRVSKYSEILARNYGSDKRYVKKIKNYASLHDVGKVGLSDKLLKKPGKYIESEFAEMKNHVYLGKKMIEELGLDKMAENIIYYHHEKWDGSGYLTGLKGEKIPLEARIVALADVYDALGSKRVYKQPFDEKEIDKIIKNGSGKHFDPELVEVYFKSKKEFLKIKG